MKLKPLVTFGETSDVKSRIYARKSKEEIIRKDRNEGFFCIDYPISRNFYLLGTDFETACGDVCELEEFEEQFSICLDSYYEALKRNPKILTKEDFFKYFNENCKDFSSINSSWRITCKNIVEEILESFDELLLEVAPIEQIIRKCDFSIYIYNPIIFYEELLTLSKEKHIPVSVVVMNDLWDKDDEYTGCLERMKNHLMMFSSLKDKSISLESFLNIENEYCIDDIYFNEVKRFFEVRLKDEYNNCKHCEDRFTCDHNFYWQYIEAEKERKRAEQLSKKKKKQKKPKKKKVQKEPKKIRDIDKELEKVLTIEEPKEEPKKEEKPLYVPKESLEIVKPARVEPKEDYFHSMNMNRREQRKSDKYQSYLKDESLMKVSKRKISKLSLNDNFMNRFKTNN